MSFFDAVVSGFKNCFVFSGRSSRSEFWWFFLFFIMFCFITLNFFLKNFPQNEAEDINSLLKSFFASWAGIALLITYIPLIALSFRRFHDINKSGWWFFFLQIVPGILPGVLGLLGIISQFAYLYFMCEKGGGENQYGRNPLQD